MRAAHRAPTAQRAADFLQRVLELRGLALEQLPDVGARRGTAVPERGDVRDLGEREPEAARARDERQQRQNVRGIGPVTG